MAHVDCAEISTQALIDPRQVYVYQIMLAINGSTHLMPRVEDPEDVGAGKMFRKRRRSSALDMSLMTVYVSLRAQGGTFTNRA